jgi:hypothetical protein
MGELSSPSNGKLDRRLAAFALLLIEIYFYRLVRPTLRSGFTPDDLMNLYRAWFFPLSALVKANLLFFLPSDFIRPMAEAWYRIIYLFAGFRPGPFHAVYLAFLFANILLVYSLARRLSNARFAALAAALLFAYHERWAPLYFDTAYIYDVLCGFFLFSVLALYLGIRQAGRTPRAWEYAALVALVICALNSKEMAIALPVIVALYEWLFESKRHWLTSAALAAITLAFAAGRTGALTQNDSYRPQFGWARLMATSAHFLNELFAGADWFTPLAVVALAAASLAISAALRSRPMLFAWGFTVAAALPIAFVPPRGAPQYYIPLFGCALYAGSLLSALAGRIPRSERLPLKARYAIAGIALFAIAWPIYTRGKYVALRDVTSVTEESPVFMSLASRLHALHPTLPHHARLLFLHGPVSPNAEDLRFLARLSYGDRTIEVTRLSPADIPPSARKMQAYDAVFDYLFERGSGGLVEVVQLPLELKPQILNIFDANWKPIEPASPARPGSRLIVLASDLGPTEPEVPAGVPFPREPLATAILRLEATVNGKSAAVVSQLGQPGQVNVYRFDLIVPSDTKPGTAQIKISAAGQTSPAAEIPVSR